MSIFLLYFLPFLTHSFTQYTAIHDLHLSRTEINIDPTSGDLQISMHIFVDDLDAALTKKFHKKYHIASEKEDTDGDIIIERYLNDVFKISTETKKLTYSYLGKEAGGEELAVWIYLEVENPGKIESLHVEQKLLLELFSDQKNIIDIKSGKKRKGFIILDSKKKKETFKL